MNLKTAIQNNGWRKDGKLLAHVMGWFGNAHYHPMTAYKSNDPLTIVRQFDVMQTVGVDGIIFTDQGLTDSFVHDTCMKLLAECEKRKMLFASLADPWMMNNKSHGEQAVIKYLVSDDGIKMLDSPSYLPEKYFLDFTNDLFDEAAVQTALRPFIPEFTVLKRHVGYSWPEIQNTIAILKSDNANPHMKIPGLFVKFFDGGNPRSDGTIDWNTQSWGSGASRSIEDQAGSTYFDALAVTPMQSKYLALVTWNDYNERTGPFETWASVFSGKRI